MYTEIIPPSPLGQLHELNAQSPEGVIVAGPAAVSLALGETSVAFPSVAEASVSEGHFRYLADQEDWRPDPDRKGWLRKDGVSVSVAPGYRTTHDDLKDRSWDFPYAEGSLSIVGLPDAYAREQHEGQLTDTPLAISVRDHLYDPVKPPLSKIVLAKTMHEVQRDLSDSRGIVDLPDFDAMVWAAADAIYNEGTVLGAAGVGRANRIFGTRRFENGRPHGYFHNAEGVLHDGRLALEHGQKARISPRGKLIGYLATVAADRHYGNGRQSDDAEFYDEKVSAELTYARAIMAGVSEMMAATARDGIYGTTFVEALRGQLARNHHNPIIRIASGADLQLVSEIDGALQAFSLLFEDHMSRRFAGDNPILAELYEHHVAHHGFVDIGKLALMIEFADMYLDTQLRPDQPTLREVGVKHMRGNANFHARGHRFPRRWMLENHAVRQANGLALTAGADCLEEGGSFKATQQVIADNLVVPYNGPDKLYPL